MTQLNLIVGKVEEVTDYDVYEDVKVVGVEVFIGGTGSEEEIE